ncbi:MurR/RpiR family transcriptional regulator [Rhizobium sp. S95]|uniref:MurR/RpiR family transcriptional regulator n=1 Tax=Ciceribacter sichuanensis TaxID=2949647 RepID=A0AAJ1C1G8_9HYPH|nr:MULTISPECIES: MurR/RpiR family transcriptional regulator [unclassified Ciceribacter]MCM2397292.1 MurR/RpiR family transcriptional regulator [Ciceribacter sp. S95]MCM2403417.1 MurR/RpiR family transcriptional regulator [Ciceribacter sp. S153]MCO5959058.1 MurR/RpiR family transcriptional regulator [Ciceribacter sp. S101]
MNEHEDSRPIDVRIMGIYDELTASERRLAAVVMEAQTNLASFTAGELAAKADISNATAARFFKRLGYASYNDARMHARQAEDWGSPLYELTGTGRKRLAPGDFGLHIAQDLQNLTRTAEMLSEADLDQAVRIIAEASRVFVVGFRNSMALANYARGLLTNIKPDVHLLPLAGVSMGEELAGIGERDVFLVLGFRRRPALLREIMAVVKESGAPSVLIADMTAARTAQLASVTLRCHNRGHSMFDSYAAPMSVINYVCSSVSQQLGDSAVERLAEIERLHERLDQLAGPVQGRKMLKD